MMPVFAVLGQVSPTGARRLAGLKINAAPAVAFFVPAEGHASRSHSTETQVLGDAGWRTAPFTEHTPVVEAWSLVAFGAPGGQGTRRSGDRVGN